MKKNEKIKQRDKVKEEFSAEAGEDATKYGEFVCSYFAWVSPDEQKEKVHKMQTMTKKK